MARDPNRLESVTVSLYEFQRKSVIDNSLNHDYWNGDDPDEVTHTREKLQDLYNQLQVAIDRDSILEYDPHYRETRDTFQDIKDSAHILLANLDDSIKQLAQMEAEHAVKQPPP